jgi:hypothetical protein
MKRANGKRTVYLEKVGIWLNDDGDIGIAFNDRDSNGKKTAPTAIIRISPDQKSRSGHPRMHRILRGILAKAGRAKAA